MTTETLAEKMEAMAAVAGLPTIANMPLGIYMASTELLAKFAALVAEDCAKVCMKQQSDLRTRQKFAAAIRARYGIKE